LIAADAELACLNKTLKANEMDHEMLTFLIDEKKEQLQAVISPKKASGAK
jgi:hypothetical protein